MQTDKSLNQAAIMTHGKVIDFDNRPIINGENAACYANEEQESDGIINKASSMFGQVKEKIANAFDNVKEVFHKSESTEDKGKNL